jgi:NADPH2:quinone reductase
MSRATRQVQVETYGDPDVMKVVEVELAAPEGKEVQVRLTAVGLNMIDTYFRTGLYPMPLPSVLGSEAAGVVEAIGADVASICVGDRVAFASGMGAYADAINIHEDVLCPIPDGVSEEQAASLLLKGMTVDYLFCRSFALSGGETVLFHAAAGGVGLIACQWARHIGVQLIGTASSAEKCALAVEYGASACFESGRADLLQQVKGVAPEKGFPVVYDSVGKDTFDLSLDALAPHGYLVSYGNSSGAPDPVPVGLLAAKGSLYLTRPTLGSFVGERAELLASAGKVFKMLEDGVLDANIRQRYKLEDVAQAHRDLQSRATTGCSVLIP